MKSSPLTTRRRFLGESACSALSSISVLNTLLNLQLAGKAAAHGDHADYKTLVCFFLDGGIDSFNWLVPRDSTRHGIYSTTRGNLALPIIHPTLPPQNLRGLNQDGGDGQLYGIHPSCAGLQELFNGLGGDTTKRRMAFVSNVGTLIQPVTKAQYLAETVPLPRALYSHRKRPGRSVADLRAAGHGTAQRMERARCRRAAQQHERQQHLHEHLAGRQQPFTGRQQHHAVRRHRHRCLEIHGQ